MCPFELANTLLLKMVKGVQSIAIVMPGLKPAHQDFRHFAGKSTPKGKIISDTDGGQIVAFDVQDLAAYLTAQGVILMAKNDQGQTTLKANPEFKKGK